ncbi:MAG TPA: hypothetical protein VG518_07700 [Solirubrobacterales bacterium]|nr:hypothetical protein [Solirubrobacterales bacterium]
MEASNPADASLAAGLASLGIEADEMDMAVISAAHQLFWGPTLELLAFDAGETAMEGLPDLARAPEKR